jgi:hypothetical protein
MMLIRITPSHEIRRGEELSLKEYWFVEVHVYLPYGERVFRVKKVKIDEKEIDAEDEYIRRLFDLLLEAKKVEVVSDGNILVAYISTA